MPAVLDWESAVLGPTAADLGWLCMIYDRPSWGPSRQPLLAPFPSPDLLVSQYGPVERLNWFRALAAFKLGSLTAHFLRLHRTGRHPDPTWEVFGEAFGYLVARAHALLDGES